MPQKMNRGTQDLEAIAIDKIVEALNGVDEQRKLSVLRFVYERFSNGGVDPQGLAELEKKNLLTNVQVPSSPADNKDIKIFLKQKDPQNPYQQVAVLAYYLKENKSIDEVNKKIMEDANKEARGRIIDDMTGVLNDAKSKYNFLGQDHPAKKFFWLMVKT